MIINLLTRNQAYFCKIALEAITAGVDILLMMSQKKSKTYRILRAELTQLEIQLNRSRVAVENITSRPIIKRKCHKELLNLRSQLQLCINNINKETTKNKILFELILDLKERFVNFQFANKKEKQLQEMKKDKEIVEAQATIDQILKRHNEQIAKITNLKDQANSMRSERVVFSNLFRKLQKQVTEHEQLYKQSLILSQQVRKRLQNTNVKKERGHVTSESDSKNKSENMIVEQYYEYSQEDSRTNTNTILMENEKTQTKFHSIRSSKHRERDLHHRTYFKEQKLLYTKELLRKISELSSELERIKIFTQVPNFQDLVERYGNLQKENYNLVQQINKLNIQIMRVQECKKNILQQERNWQFSNAWEQRSEQINPFELLGFQIKSFKLLGADEQTNSFVDIFDEMSDILKLELRKNSKNIPNKESLQALDEKIQLFSEQQILEERIKENNLYSNSIICCILEKMQKFGACQKIFDDKLLREEYYKQIGTRKQIKSRKLILK